MNKSDEMETKRTTINIPVALYEWIQHEAAREFRSVSGFLCALADAEMQRRSHAEKTRDGRA